MCYLYVQGKHILVRSQFLHTYMNQLKQLSWYPNKFENNGVDIEWFF